jgi:hypothetical protein
MSEESSFWDTVIGKIVRWLVYIPFGIITSYLVLGLSTISSLWLIYNLRGTIILLILLGGIPFLFYCYGMGKIYLETISYSILMCPNPKIGNVLFGTVYYPFCLFYCKHMLFARGGDEGIKFVIILHAAVAMIITSYVLVKSYSEEKP